MRTHALLLLIALAAAIAAPAAAQPAPAACAHDRKALLALDVRTFDKRLGQGWRVVADQKGCEAIAADLIAAYRAEHAAALVDGPIDNLRGLLRHESQLRAAVGQIDRAIRLRQYARENGDRPQQLYDDATIAFLKKDRPALDTARHELAALPKPAWFEEAAARAKAEHGLDVAWPPNLDAVEGFAACFDRPYAEAYSQTCRDKAQP